MREKTKDIDPQETQEWLESIEDALEEHGNKRAGFCLKPLFPLHNQEAQDCLSTRTRPL